MTKKITLLVLLTFFSLILNTWSQTPTRGQMSNTDIENLSDDQIRSYWEKAKAEGYSIQDLDIIGPSQGLSQRQISQLKRRIQDLPSTSGEQQKTTSPESFSFTETSKRKLDLNPSVKDTRTESEIFGYSFFNNPNITFEPSINLSVPSKYVLGPGDEITVNVYGAAENNYTSKISPAGSITIPNVGPIFLSGLTLDKAKIKINGKLRRIYSGIGASKSSPYKVYTDISISNIRTVQVNIIGEVEVPGSYSLSALSTVLNALYASGGPSKNGTFRDILLVRDGVVIANFDIYDFLIRGNSEGNLYLNDQDAIIVRPYKERITVIGEAKRPGIYELMPTETLDDLKLYFGGFSSQAYKDRVIIERISGNQLKIEEVELGGIPVILKDGDKVSIGAVVDRFENRVMIEGAIYRPGNYPLESTTNLSDIFAKSLGVKDDAFVDRAILYRQIEGYKKKAISFSVSDVVSEVMDMRLQREDSIYVFSKKELKEIQNINISGAVNDPKKIPYIENLTVEDFVAMAGGFEYGADPKNILVSRLILDEDVTTLSEQFKYATTEKLEVENAAEFILKPNDKVNVFYLKGFEKLKSVTVMGEVGFPGEYVITSKNQRVSDILEKAGGLTQYAYAKGATLIRNIALDENANEQKQVLQDLAVKDSIAEVDSKLDETNTNFRIGLDLISILKEKETNAKKDLILEDGDELIIPSLKQTVEVRGEVLAPSLIRYDKSNSLKDYVNGSGGFTTNAKKSKAYVLYPNGEVRATKRFLFFKNYPKVEPGSVILVPPEPIKSNGLSVQEIIGITTGLGTIGLIIDRLSN